MRIAEEFERCKECGGGWFRIEHIVLVRKGSSVDDPVLYEERKEYICTQCDHIQYVKKL